MSDAGLCHCGCGLPAPIAAESSKRDRWVKGQPKRFIHGHNGRGKPRAFSEETIRRMGAGQRRRLSDPKNHPRWKGGLVLQEGYWRIHRPDHPRAGVRGYVKRCILVLEKKLGRSLLPNEVPHHKNGNKADDREENLVAMGSREHKRIHSIENHHKWRGHGNTH